MLPTRTSDEVKFTPDHYTEPGGTTPPAGAPVYFLKPASLYDRATWNRELRRLVGRAVAPERMRAALHEAVDALFPDDDDHRRLLHDDLDLVHEIADRAAELARKAVQARTVEDDAAADEAAREDTIDEGSIGERAIAGEDPQRVIEAQRRVAELDEIADRDFGPYRELQAQQQAWWTVARLLAAQMFLRGVGKVGDQGDAKPRRFKRGRGDLVLESELAALPPEDLPWIGVRAIGLMSPTERDRRD